MLKIDSYHRFTALGGEVLIKDRRPFLLTIVRARGFTFAIPLRSNLPTSSNISNFVTKKSDKSAHKWSGLDFQKALIVEEDDFVNLCYPINKAEFKKLKASRERIEKKFADYLTYYIESIQNNTNKKHINLTRSSLQYFHKELGIRDDLK